MDQLAEHAIGCPYCGEQISVLIDPEEVGQEYIEDCQVCCRPITFLVAWGPGGELAVSAYDENSAF